MMIVIFPTKMSIIFRALDDIEPFGVLYNLNFCKSDAFFDVSQCYILGFFLIFRIHDYCRGRPNTTKRKGGQG